MSSRNHIVVVDDDPDLRSLIHGYLENAGFKVTPAANGRAMRRIITEHPADLVILDVVMPGEGGLALTRHLRENSDVGIIILTGRGETIDRVVGLEMGADDYLGKPFELRELLARVRSVLRRAEIRAASPESPRDSVRFAGWKLDLPSRRLVSPGGEDVALTTAEFALLSALVNNPNRIMSRERLLDLTHRPGPEPFDRSIDVLILRLRRKIEADPKRPTLIKTVRGSGYVFTPDVERE